MTNAPAAPDRVTTTRRVRAIVSLCRPRQWVKNVLVFAAPAAAGELTTPSVFARTMLAFAVFCAAASATYCINDAADAAADRLHPKKRFRPVAAGLVSPTGARVIAAALALGIVAAVVVTGSSALGLTALAYLINTTAYSLWLKHRPVFDLAGVTAGFVIRALAGAAAAKVPVSDWFLIVTTFGSLFMVTGKRSAELMGDDGGGTSTRKVLNAYPPGFLGQVRSTAASVTLLAYCLWAFEKSGAHGLGDSTSILRAGQYPWYQLSIGPFVLAILRYGLRLDQGRGAAPEEIVLGDRPLQALGLAWMVLFALGVRYG